MHLLLFFTYRVSLKTWAESGLLDREISLYKKLADQGIKTTFITYGDREDYHYKDKIKPIEVVPFYAFSRRPKFEILRMIHSLLLPFALKGTIKEADLLKTNQMFGSWAALLSKLLYKKKMILRCGFEFYFQQSERRKNHFSPFLIMASVLSHLSYRYADKIILTSQSIANYAVTKFGASRNDITVISNFVDIEKFKPLDVQKNNRILFIGRLSKQKNLFNLLDAVSRTSCELDIVGEGLLKDKIKVYIEKNKVRANLLGRYPNDRLPEIINQYSIFVLPSYYEGNPKTLLEAMACGCAVIGTRVQGIRDVIEDGVTGILCETSSEAIAHTVERLIQEESLQRYLGKNARQFIVENCNLSTIVNKEMSVYSTLC